MIVAVLRKDRGSASWPTKAMIGRRTASKAPDRLQWLNPSRTPRWARAFGSDSMPFSEIVKGVMLITAHGRGFCD
jgi:hypothetical protein